MRVSVDPGDPGYLAEIRSYGGGGGVKVFLGGVERTHVVTADEEKRFIVCHRLDVAGRPLLNPGRTAVLRDVEYGDVRVELAPPLLAIVQARELEAKRIADAATVAAPATGPAAGDPCSTS